MGLSRRSVRPQGQGPGVGSVALMKGSIGTLGAAGAEGGLPGMPALRGPAGAKGARASCANGLCR